MNRHINLAVIGMGWMGSVHSHCYRLIPHRFPELNVTPRLVVCADNVEARARDGVTRMGFEHSTTDWREAIARSDVDTVVITTHNALHKTIALEAISAGKHVFCEKPVAVDGPGVRHVLETVKQAKQKDLSIVSGLCWR